MAAGRGRISSATLSQARADLEATILDHLLRKDDAFFAARPPAGSSIVCRPISDASSNDGTRAISSDRRSSSSRATSGTSSARTGGSPSPHSRFAPPVRGPCGLTLPVKEMDKTYLATDDRVKAMFEDYLRASPEAQVAWICAGHSRAIREAAGGTTLFLRFSWLRRRINVVSGTAYLLAFVSLCVILVYFRGARSNLQLALIRSSSNRCRALLHDASQLVVQRLNLQLADTSEKRLLEYDSGAVTVAEATKDFRRACVVEVGTRPTAITADGTLQGRHRRRAPSSPTVAGPAIVSAAGSEVHPCSSDRRTDRPASISVREGWLRDAFNAADRASSPRCLSLAILDATIAENLVFARHEHPRRRTISRSSRIPAWRDLPDEGLTMVPLHQDDELAERVTELRARMRERLGGGFVVPSRTGGRGSRRRRRRAPRELARPRAPRRAALSSRRRRSPRSQRPCSAQGARLASRRCSRHARAPRPLSYAAYAKLAPHPILVWQRRVAVLGTKRTCAIVLVALTSKVREYGRLRRRSSQFRALAGVSVPFGMSLSTRPWRDNLRVRTPRRPNSRAEGRIERHHRHARRGRLTDEMTRIGHLPGRSRRHTALRQTAPDHRVTRAFAPRARARRGDLRSTNSRARVTRILRIGPTSRWSP